MGLDVGGTKILGALLDGDAQLLDSVRLPTVAGAASVIETAVRVVERLAHAAQAPVSALHTDRVARWTGSPARTG